MHGGGAGRQWELCQEVEYGDETSALDRLEAAMVGLGVAATEPAGLGGWAV